MGPSLSCSRKRSSNILFRYVFLLVCPSLTGTLYKASLVSHCNLADSKSGARYIAHYEPLAVELCLILMAEVDQRSLQPHEEYHDPAIVVQGVCSRYCVAPDERCGELVLTLQTSLSQARRSCTSVARGPRVRLVCTFFVCSL